MKRASHIVLLCLLGVGCSEGNPTVFVFPDLGPQTTFLCSVDAQCDDGVFCNGVETCDPSAADADELGCAPAAAGPCLTGQTCNEAEVICVNDCAVEADADGDGAEAMACGGDDCDDADPNNYPGNTEVCDAAGHDEDCDDTTFGDRDTDGDGFVDALCCNGANCGNDCDDMDASLRPNGAEACDGLDNDCDGTTDEGVDQVFYPDTDGDGYGDMASSGSMMRACQLPEGFALNALDCDDTMAGVNPGAFDRCDGMRDDDCSGTPDDPAGGCSCNTGESRVCPLPGLCGTGSQDCVDGLWTVCTVLPTPEVCDGLDNDCNGEADEGCPCAPGGTVPCGTDVGQCSAGVRVCGANGTLSDCIAAVGPSVESCNTLDDDCDGTVDENAPLTTWFEDTDGDGVGVLTMDATQACVPPQPTGFVPLVGDCYPEDADYVCSDNERRVGFFNRANDMLRFDGAAGTDIFAVGSPSGGSASLMLFRRPADRGGVWVPMPPPLGGLTFGTLDNISAGATAIVAGGDGQYYWPIVAGSLQDPIQIAALGNTRAIAADFDSNGTTDAIVFNGSVATARLYDGMGGFASLMLASNPGFVGVSNDATPNDIYVIASNTVTRYRWNEMIASFDVIATGGVFVDSDDCQVVTMDGDGQEDLICERFGDLRVVRLDLSMPTAYSVSNTIESVGGMYSGVGAWETADFDGDGYTDLFVSVDGRVEYWHNEMGSFVRTRLLERSVNTLDVFDVDGDGDLDLVVSGFGDIDWIENRGGRLVPAGAN